LPKGLNQQPTDLCQLGNFVCDPYGRLVKLSLGFAQFSCDLPTELARFKQLRTLELDESDFRGSSMNDLAKVSSDPIQRLHHAVLCYGLIADCKLVKLM
jgi:hypothetical protein